MIITGLDVHRGKPAPDGYLLAASRIGLDPHRCVAFEHAEAGLTAALASDSTTVVVGNHRSPQTAALPRLVDYTTARVTGTPGTVEIRTR